MRSSAAKEQFDAVLGMVGSEERIAFTLSHEYLHVLLYHFVDDEASYCLDTLDWDSTINTDQWDPSGLPTQGAHYVDK